MQYRNRKYEKAVEYNKKANACDKRIAELLKMIECCKAEIVIQQKRKAEFEEASYSYLESGQEEERRINTQRCMSC